MLIDSDLISSYADQLLGFGILSSLIVDRRGQDVGGFVPSIMLRRLRLRRVPYGRVGDQPPLSSDCLLRSLRAFSDCFVDSAGGCCSPYGEDSM